jgi:hypothetical protein
MFYSFYSFLKRVIKQFFYSFLKRLLQHAKIQLPFSHNVDTVAALNENVVVKVVERRGVTSVRRFDVGDRNSVGGLHDDVRTEARSPHDVLVLDQRPVGVEHRQVRL